MKKHVINVFIYALLVSGSLVMLYPLLFGLFAGFMSPNEYIINTSFFPVPKPFHLAYYIGVITDSKMLFMIRNTVIRIMWYLVLNIIFPLVLGYLFSKRTFRFKNAIFMLLLASMMIPGQATMVPSYIMLARWPLLGGNNILGMGGHGMLDSWWALLIPGMVNVYFMFLFKQSYDSVPNDFEESARLDGAGTLRIIFRIYFNLLKPVAAVTAFSTIIGVWNDFFTPLIYTSGTKLSNLTISLGIGQIASQFQANQLLPNYPAVFAAATIATIPTILVYSFFQKYLIQGMAMTGLKG